MNGMIRTYRGADALAGPLLYLRATRRVARLRRTSSGRSPFRSPPLGPSREWVSATPYIATRVPRDHGRHAADDARFWRARTDEELAESRGLSRPLRRHVLADAHGWLASNLKTQLREVLGIGLDNVTIAPLLDGPAFTIADRWRPIQFKRFRAKQGDRGGTRLAGACDSSRFLTQVIPIRCLLCVSVSKSREPEHAPTRKRASVHRSSSRKASRSRLPWSTR